MALSQDEKSALKLSQIYKCRQYFSTIKIFDKLLEKEGDINYAISVDNPYGDREKYLSNCTALYFAYEARNLYLFGKLLEIGADFTKQNNIDQTVLHMMVQDLEEIDKPLDEPFINAVLSAHMNTKIILNPYDNRGISHFHIACMTNNLAVVQFFLDNGVLVDDPIHIDKEVLPGCTPLHLTAKYTNIKMAEVLLANGANMHATDVNGMSVLHTLIKRRMEMFDSKGKTLSVRDFSYKLLQEQIKENELMINLLMEKNMSSDNDCLDHIGLSNFHVACMLQDTPVAQYLVDSMKDLDHSLNVDSQLWPGYTALHFAAHVSLDNVEMLVKKGANLGKPDSAGITPLDICIERYRNQDICRIISFNADWDDITFSDGRTNLKFFLCSLTNRKLFKILINRPDNDMNMSIPMESPLWPGFTPLHLAVRFAEKSNPMFKEDENELSLQILRLCLKNGSDLSAQNSRGQTALHLAYRLKKMKVVHLILRHSHEIPNTFDEDNLSHLHIVCAESKTMCTLKKCVIDNSNVNAVYNGRSPILKVTPGFTPLHVCLVNFNRWDVCGKKIRKLLCYSVDVNIKDAYGLTPIHWLLKIHASHDTDQLLKLVTSDCVAEEYGLSYLHVMCHLNNIEASKRLLDNGVDVNLRIKYTKQNDKDPLTFLSLYDKRTPSNMISHMFPNLSSLLVDYGVDAFSQIVFGLTEIASIGFYSRFFHMHALIRNVRNNIELQTLMRREFGWTRLHLACCSLEDDKFEDVVRAEIADVNAQIYSNSPIWKGYTPLHSLMQYSAMANINFCLKLLLENGADVTVTDDAQNTPITLHFSGLKHDTVKRLLLKYHRNFNVNPVNSEGISHFHIACYLSDVDAVRGFLSHGVEVNRPIGHFANWSPGRTPLHLTTNFEIVDLLINHGADINIEDVNGYTALHTAVKCDAFDEIIVKKLIESGAEVNRPNYKGETPFEVALCSGLMAMDQLKFFIRHSFIVNSCNPIDGVGYIAMTLRTRSQNRNLQELIFETIMNENPTSSCGRNTLHYLVTRESPFLYPSNYVSLIERVIKSGCNIDDQDHDGKTALHLAVESEYTNKIIKALLLCGADINLLDNHGQTALSYTSSVSCQNDRENQAIENLLIIHAIQLDILELDLSHNNRAAVCKAQILQHEIATNRVFHQQLVAAKAIELGVRSMRLGDFLSETGAVGGYRLLTELERCKIDQYFNSIHNDERLAEISGLLKLQYRKAVKRVELYPSAMRSFSSLIGFHLPYLCAENIFQHLRNSDLKNIMNTIIGNEDTNIGAD